ncbi:MAG: hypothetical protein FD129_1131 [bacterium]|nr:MAG: hypothetical protein FD129_1131 [bacterium]
MTLRNKNGFWPITAALAITILTLSGSQCSQVADRAVGPDSGTLDQAAEVAACVQACNESAKGDRDSEKQLHKANIEACNGDETCLAEEEARHEAQLDEINAEMQFCKAPCHEQGGGTGGQ